MGTLAQQNFDKIEATLDKLQDVYIHFHQHPELSHKEYKTAAIVASRLKELGFEVTEKVGHTGVVGILENGGGATVMLRADMDALPIIEKTGLPYASQEDGVMHACGHDLHMSCLLGASEVLANSKETWQGRLMVVFQPSEENGKGAQSMIDDGMMTRFPKPDVILGQHTFPMKSGLVACRSGQFMSSGDSLKVTFFGRGAHGSQPQNSIDPVIMVCSAVMRLQTIISREINPLQSAVVTVGEIHGGVAENIISDSAYFTLNIRTTDEAVRNQIISAIRRICLAESQASNGVKDPVFEEISSFPVTMNDEVAAEKIQAIFQQQFGDNFFEAEKWSVSEDFTVFARNWIVPSVFWQVGVIDPKFIDELTAKGELDRLPGLHSPYYAPTIKSSLRTGIETFVCAAGGWLKQLNR